MRLSRPVGHELDPNVVDLRTRFAKISRKADWRDWRKRLPRRLLPFVIAFTVCVWGILAISQISPWPLGITFRHIAAANNCATARAVGLAPALRGEPGYWPWLDRDHDGIACEKK